MEVRLDGKIVLVTGSTQGVGAAIAEAAARSGVGRNPFDRAGCGPRRRGCREDQGARPGHPFSPRRPRGARRAGADRPRVPRPLRADRPPRQRRRADRPRLVPRCRPRRLGEAVRRQRPRAVLPDAGGDPGDAGAGRRRGDRQYPVDERALRDARTGRLFGDQGRARDADPERRQRPPRRTASRSTASTWAGSRPTAKS